MCSWEWLTLWLCSHYSSLRSRTVSLRSVNRNTMEVSSWHQYFMKSINTSILVVPTALQRSINWLNVVSLALQEIIDKLTPTSMVLCVQESEFVINNNHQANMINKDMQSSFEQTIVSAQSILYRNNLVQILVDTCEWPLCSKCSVA